MVLAGISHDVRTPLSRLRLALEMSGAEPAAAEAMAADIGEIDGIIGQFLDFARGENEEKAEHDLDALVLELGEHYTRIHRKVSVKAGTAAPVRMARTAVRRAVANLIDNALRYAGEPVEVETGKFFVEVRDRGPGIAPDEVDHAKRPFTRLDAARGGPAGAGLGLAIVERVARAHGGSLELLPRPGGGLIARLNFNHP
jgi:two-component system osmolarity sensor histidine kinase EnvZ